MKKKFKWKNRNQIEIRNTNDDVKGWERQQQEWREKKNEYWEVQCIHVAIPTPTTKFHETVSKRNEFSRQVTQAKIESFLWREMKRERENRKQMWRRKILSMFHHTLHTWSSHVHWFDFHVRRARHFHSMGRVSLCSAPISLHHSLFEQTSTQILLIGIDPLPQNKINTQHNEQWNKNRWFSNI